MRVLVTGGCGFIGSNFVRYLLNKHDDSRVTNLDRLSYGSSPTNLTGVDRGRYSFVKGDISDEKLVRRLMRRADSVVNFAAESHVDRSISNPGSVFDSNVKGVMVLLEALREAGNKPRFVQVSTDEVYGSLRRGSANEGSAVMPSSPYAASKAAADAFCIAYQRTFGLNLSVCRCTNNFGPYQFPEKFIPKAIIRAARGQRIPVYGDGRNVRDWIFVSDHCEAISMVLDRGREGEIYNISAGNEVANIRVVREILKILRKPADLVEFVEDRPGHDLRYSLDSAKIRKELGWGPRQSFARALRYTVSWYLNNESWWRPLATKVVLHPTPWKVKW